MRLRLSQPPAGDWLAGAWAELGNNGNIDDIDNIDDIGSIKIYEYW